LQITKLPGANWSPNWSPDGKYIAYRSENGDGGLYVVPAFGGDGLERKISSFGYYPRWSPNGAQILFQTTEHTGLYSNWTCDPSSYSIWTQPYKGGPAIKSEISAEMLRQVNEVGLGAGIPEVRDDFFFTWAPSGKAIYLEQTFRGAKNIWRMEVDPTTLRTLSLRRITTGARSDTELALSTDGKKLAFTSVTRHVRAWAFPFDANGGRLKGAGKPVTPSGRFAWQLSLSRDAKKLAYRADRQGRIELWQTSLADGRELLISGDDFRVRSYPQWSPDGRRLAYSRDNTFGEVQLINWSPLTSEEMPVTEPNKLNVFPYDR
jgi:Tol biopolymer transport system component